MGAVVTRPPGETAAAVPEDDYARQRLEEMRTRLVVAGVPLIERADGNPLVTDRDIYSDMAWEIERYLRGLTIPQLICLAYGHSWPVLIPGRAAPKGFRVLPEPQRQGIYRLTEACTRDTAEPGGRRKVMPVYCGTARTSLTLPRGIGIDRDRSRSYAYDDNEWEIRPQGSRLTRIDFLNEIMRRMGRELFPGEFEGIA